MVRQIEAKFRQPLLLLLFSRRTAISLHLILLIVAFVLFVVAAIGVPSRVNLVAAGLACWVLTAII